MKALITFSTLLALLSIGAVTFAGPAPGEPGLGARVGDLSRSRAEERASSSQPYALKGRPDEGPRAGCGDVASLSRAQKQRCDPNTSVSHRRYPGGVH